MQEIIPVILMLIYKLLQLGFEHLVKSLIKPIRLWVVSTRDSVLEASEFLQNIWYRGTKIPGSQISYNTGRLAIACASVIKY